MKAWLLVQNLGLPRWGWILVVLLAVVETLLGRSEDPRWRSLGDSIRNALGIVVVPVLEKFPGGLVVIMVLRALKAIPEDAPVRYSKKPVVAPKAEG